MKKIKFFVLVTIILLILAYTHVYEGDNYIDDCPDWSDYPQSAQCEHQIAFADNEFQITFNDWEIVEIDVSNETVVVSPDNIVIHNQQGELVGFDQILQGKYRISKENADNNASLWLKKSPATENFSVAMEYIKLVGESGGD